VLKARAVEQHDDGKWYELSVDFPPMTLSMSARVSVKLCCMLLLQYLGRSQYQLATESDDLLSLRCSVKSVEIYPKPYLVAPFIFRRPNRAPNLGRSSLPPPISMILQGYHG
jgi:hypothetical protein